MSDRNAGPALPADMRAYNRTLIEQYRAGGGIEGRPLLLLTTTGARSGEARTTPLGYAPDGGPDRLVVFASNMGAGSAPAWYHNLVAHPDVTVEVGADRFPARASVPGGAERDRLYALWLERFPSTADHQARAGRTIPMVLVERLSGR
jgi:deazaflavin-dependent oxidoreductase (nitroreductase family)